MDKNIQIFENAEFGKVRTIVINDDAISVSFSWKQKLAKRSNQIGAIIFVCVHGCLCYAMVCHRMRQHTNAG